MKKLLILITFLTISANVKAGIISGDNSFSNNIIGTEQLKLTAEEKRNNFLKPYYPHIKRCLNIMQNITEQKNNLDSARFNFITEKSVNDFKKYKKDIEDSFTADEREVYTKQKSIYKYSKCLELVAKLDKQNQQTSLVDVNTSVNINLYEKVKLGSKYVSYKDIMEESTLCAAFMPMHKSVKNKESVTKNFLDYAKALNSLSGSKYNISNIMRKQSKQVVDITSDTNKVTTKTVECLNLYSFVSNDITRLLNDR